MPSLHLGASGGVFGGGPGSELPNADGRGDVDLLAVWELQNLGVGHVASLRQRRSQLHQTELEMLAMRDRVAAEVATAAADVASYREQVELARGAVSLAKEAHRLIAERVRQREGRPTDLLASINTLGKALDGYTHTAAEHNRSQYRLLRAIGTAPTATE
ncbi:MAG: TolC family protein [Planctomycetota bacterium]